jgi:hypothetical protein
MNVFCATHFIEAYPTVCFICFTNRYMTVRLEGQTKFENDSEQSDNKKACNNDRRINRLKRQIHLINI